MFYQLGDPIGSVEEGILGMGVKVNEGHIRYSVKSEQ